MVWPTLLALGGAATAAAPTIIGSKGELSGPSLPGNPSNKLSTQDQLAYLNSLQPSEQAITNTTTAPDKALDITPSIYVDSAGNYKIGLTPQTQELITLKKQEDTPQVTTPTAQKNAVATPSTDIDALVKATLRGNYGNGADRKKALGANYDAVQKAINSMNLPKASGSKTSKAKEPSVVENLNKNSGNWMDTLNSLLPYLALALGTGAGAYYLGRRS